MQLISNHHIRRLKTLPFGYPNGQMPICSPKKCIVRIDLNISLIKTGLDGSMSESKMVGKNCTVAGYREPLYDK